jgi:hypothetical protein
MTNVFESEGRSPQQELRPVLFVRGLIIQGGVARGKFDRDPVTIVLRSSRNRVQGDKR